MALAAIEAATAAEQRRLDAQLHAGDGSDETLAGLRSELHETLEDGAGVFRDEPSLRRSCDTIRELKERMARVSLTDTSRTFNLERTTALELENMLDVGEAVVHSALARTESRGSHQRSDYPDRDDEGFLKHSFAYRTDDEPRIGYLDVTITQWPPGERIYGGG